MRGRGPTRVTDQEERWGWEVWRTPKTGVNGTYLWRRTELVDVTVEKVPDFNRENDFHETAVDPTETGPKRNDSKSGLTSFPLIPPSSTLTHFVDRFLCLRPRPRAQT